jgi:hypothetical protein
MKVQPNFSFQSYQSSSDPEDEKKQFIFQLQRQHIVVANSINTTVDDISYFTTPRQTGTSWLESTYVWTVTLPTSSWTAGGTVNTIAMPITGNFRIISLQGFIDNGTLSTSTTDPLPYIDVTTPANSIQMQRIGTNIILTSGGTNYSAYSGYVLVKYIQN